MFNQILTQIEKKNTLFKNKSKEVKFHALDLQFLFKECCNKYSILQSIERQKKQLMIQMHMKNNKNIINLEEDQVKQQYRNRPNAMQRTKQSNRYNINRMQVNVIEELVQQSSLQQQKPTKKHAKKTKRLQKFLQECHQNLKIERNNKQRSSIKQSVSASHLSKERAQNQNQPAFQFIPMQRVQQMKKSKSIPVLKQKLMPSKELFNLTSNSPHSLVQESKKSTSPQVVQSVNTTSARKRKIRKCPINNCKKYIFSQIGYFNHMIEFHPSYNSWIEEARANYMREHTKSSKNGDKQTHENSQAQMESKCRQMPNFVILNVDDA